MDNGHDLVTKQDLAPLRQDVSVLKQDVSLLRTDFGTLKEQMEMNRTESLHQFHDLQETMRDIQTEILKAFYSYAEISERRQVSAESDILGLRHRMALLEIRQTTLEKRVAMPPEATPPGSPSQSPSS